jgi:hypothetical protein
MAVRHLKRYASWVQTVEDSYHVAIHIMIPPQSESLEEFLFMKNELVDQLNHGGTLWKHKVVKLGISVESISKVDNAEGEDN